MSTFPPLFLPCVPAECQPGMITNCLGMLLGLGGFAPPGPLLGCPNPAQSRVREHPAGPVAQLHLAEFGVNSDFLPQNIPARFMLETPGALAWCCLRWGQLLLLAESEEMSRTARGGNKKPPSS